ncbi:MAG: hypothetical protein ACFB13_06300 [Kiloniellaceae bacterium]
MRGSKAITACAASVLAMVFSVQQGDHGPLVVYKLQVPQAAAPDLSGTPQPLRPPPVIIGDPIIEDPVAPAPRAARVGPLEPTVLGTVVMPAKRLTPAPLPTAAPLPTEAGVTVAGVPDSARVYRIVEDFEGPPPLINEKTGAALTLQDINEAVVWRRDTARKLRQDPFVPRF